jgi:hypothetical protein
MSDNSRPYGLPAQYAEMATFELAALARSTNQHASHVAIRELEVRAERWERINKAARPPHARSATRVPVHPRDRPTERSMNTERYWVCDECGHIETRPGHADDQCENCGYWECVPFPDLDEAKEYSERVCQCRTADR